MVKVGHSTLLQEPSPPWQYTKGKNNSKVFLFNNNTNACENEGWKQNNDFDIAVLLFRPLSLEEHIQGPKKGKERQVPK